ncbi:MAG: iron ABC transporter permease [Betaproteobacteria bacterium]|nr:iron ABC transporter permease [Betaproteobacteria bacterium]
MSRPLLFTVFSIAAMGSLFAALALGTFPSPALQVLGSVVNPVPDVVHDVVWKLRAPRAFAAFACGGLLAAAGALLQVLLRNALADPYILGVSSGASLGALLALTMGAGVLAMNAAAFGGAVAAIVIVFGLGFRSGDRNAYRLLLTGVVLATGLSALVSLTLVMAPPGQVKGMLFWLMGDLAYAESPIAAWIVLGMVLAYGMARAIELDLLGLGRIKAGSLGVGITWLQIGVFGVAALATVAAVMLGGAIGFVGLMVPHAIRLLGVAEHRVLLPLAVLAGGTFLTLADTAARTVWAPQQMPVGVLTALIGVPAMLLLLGRRR